MVHYCQFVQYLAVPYAKFDCNTCFSVSSIEIIVSGQKWAKVGKSGQKWAKVGKSGHFSSTCFSVSPIGVIIFERFVALFAIARSM
jgi:hypothetical protein